MPELLIHPPLQIKILNQREFPLFEIQSPEDKSSQCYHPSRSHSCAALKAYQLLGAEFFSFLLRLRLAILPRQEAVSLSFRDMGLFSTAASQRFLVGC
ncbi:hypothetical protein [Coleofasciculus sp. FACHB-SPT36]|uniref:hypothetical protein n=1 Tax=Cyanophyceae TaxID=3028117 RepID=UPI00168B4E60|nr:hypothetical protein [Coleofasciculus sp. FACHB-SPT36]MBD2539045.1 hypothetical protein [Coleofasciculus sp. FACHB-SPT36]